MKTKTKTYSLVKCDENSIYKIIQIENLIKNGEIIKKISEIVENEDMSLLKRFLYSNNYDYSVIYDGHATVSYSDIWELGE
jgi:hypothetical protein